MTYKFQIDEKVKIASEDRLRELNAINGTGVIDSMIPYADCEVVITNRYLSGAERFRERYNVFGPRLSGDYYWIAEALEPLEQESCFEPLADEAIENFFV